MRTSYTSERDRFEPGQKPLQDGHVGRVTAPPRTRARVVLLRAAMALALTLALACGRRTSGVSAGGDADHAEGTPATDAAQGSKALGVGSAGAPGATGSHLPGATAGTERAGSAAVQCKAACEHRAQCGVPGAVATCVSDCMATEVLGSEADRQAYIAADCKAVKAGEPAFQANIGCMAACEHRKSCMPEKSDLKGCAEACLQLRLPRKDLDTYTAADCENAKKTEPEFLGGMACLRTCKHVLECKVSGTLDDCTSECLGNLSRKAYTVETLQKYEAAECELVRKDIRITPRRAAGGGGGARAGGGGGGGGAAFKPCWTISCAAGCPAHCNSAASCRKTGMCAGS